jgi:hypothetical protein
VINPNLEDQKYLSILNNVKKKIIVAKIRTNSHELHSERRRWIIHKTSWVERICYFCDTKRVEDEKHFLLECHMYPTLNHNFKIFVTIPTLLNF